MMFSLVNKKAYIVFNHPNENLKQKFITQRVLLSKETLFFNKKNLS